MALSSIERVAEQTSIQQTIHLNVEQAAHLSIEQAAHLSIKQATHLSVEQVAHSNVEQAVHLNTDLTFHQFIKSTIKFVASNIFSIEFINSNIEFSVYIFFFRFFISSLLNVFFFQFFSQFFFQFSFSTQHSSQFDQGGKVKFLKTSDDLLNHEDLCPFISWDSSSDPEKTISAERKLSPSVLGMPTRVRQKITTTRLQTASMGVEFLEKLQPQTLSGD